MRNLEQIQEHRAGDDESVVRKAGVFIMAAGTTMALVYGLGALMQQRPEHREHDPLAALAAAFFGGPGDVDLVRTPAALAAHGSHQPTLLQGFS